MNAAHLILSHDLQQSLMVTDIRPGDYGGDDDSLFGSPPPSPRQTGRPAFSALALPGKGSQSGNVNRSNTNAAASTQNVGTIALPGSQHNSELPINPLALSLNHSVVHRPPALLQVQTQAASSQARTNVNASSNMSSTHRAANSTGEAPTSTRSAGKTKKWSRPSSSSRHDSEPPTPRGMEFTLPDPSAPPPVHFLRNQENLLGTAGRVAGVKPAAITHTRGTTPSNPILVDDEDAPLIGRQHRTRFRETSQPSIDPAKLSAPSNEEIVSVLVGQKDIFPVLESILKLIAKGVPQRPAPRHTGFERRQPGDYQNTAGSTAYSQPAKKRKLNRVPAGASDWDVPYPFPEGEGPTAYEQTWERERGKQLISELIKLIKVAARKAATKKYLSDQEKLQVVSGGKDQQSERDRKVNGYYRPETAMYGLGMDQPHTGKVQEQILKDTSNASHLGKGSTTNNSQLQERPASTTSSSSAMTNFNSPPTDLVQANLAFDQLFSSLAAVAPGEGPSSSALASGLQLGELSTSSIQPTEPEGVDQNMFDTWMTFLDAFPVSFESTSDSSIDVSNASTPSATTPSLRSTPGLDNHGSFPPNSSTNPSDFQAILNSMLGHPILPVPSSGVQEPLSSFDFDFATVAQVMPSSIVDHQIDPSLLAISTPRTESSSNLGENMDLDTMQAASPMPSMSSFEGSADPTTPASANWDLSLPDVFVSDGGAGGHNDGQGMWGNSLWAGLDGVTQQHLGGVGDGIGMDMNELTASFGTLPPVIVQEVEDRARLDKGKERAVEPVSTPPHAASVAQTPFHGLLGMKISDDLFKSMTAAPAKAATTSTAISKGTKPRPPTNAVPRPTPRQLRKDGIIKRAQERRQQLQEELDSVKRQLWETTIEQAALIHLTRLEDITSSSDAGRNSNTGILWKQRSESQHETAADDHYRPS